MIPVIENKWICITPVPFLSESLQDGSTFQVCVVKKYKKVPPFSESIAHLVLLMVDTKD